MHFAVCDDDKYSLDAMADFLDQYRAQHCPAVTYELFSDPLALLTQLAYRHFDLLLLDILMPQKGGLELAHEIRNQNKQIPIIFLTSAPEFAVASYRVQAQDYLLKPVERSLFFASLDRQIAYLAQQQDTILVQTMHAILHIPVNDIVYIETVNRKLQLAQADGTTIETAATLHEIEQALAPYPQFVRPHRSYVVNLDYVVQLEKTRLHTTIGTVIPIARGNTDSLKQQYLDCMLAPIANER